MLFRSDSVRFGIQAIQNQKVSITKQSISGIKEYRNYLWMSDKDGRIISPNQPEKGNDHFLDACRYGVSSLIPIINRKQLIEQMPFPQRKLKPAPWR